MHSKKQNEFPYYFDFGFNFDETEPTAFTKRAQ